MFSLLITEVINSENNSKRGIPIPCETVAEMRLLVSLLTVWDPSGS